MASLPMGNKLPLVQHAKLIDTVSFVRKFIAEYDDSVKKCDDVVYEMREKYGADLIRVDWRFAKPALESDLLKHVCTWSNGDEGFVFKKEESDGDK